MEIGKAFVVAHRKGKHHAPLVVVPELTGDPLARVTRKEECVLVDKRLEGDEEGIGPPGKQFDVPRRERVRANLYVETGRRVGDGDAAFGHREDVERDGENAVSELVRGPGGGHRASEGPTGRAVLTRPGFGTTLSARTSCQDSAVARRDNGAQRISGVRIHAGRGGVGIFCTDREAADGAHAQATCEYRAADGHC